MALVAKRSMKSSILELPHAEEGLFQFNHIFEPEYHQDKYVDACNQAKAQEGAFQIGDLNYIESYPFRGVQPSYADDEQDETTLEYEGMVTSDGNRLDSGSDKRNICALKSACVRWGYLDLALARSVSREFYTKKEKRAAARKNDALVNSTGDGTIGRVAVYPFDFPAMVDGHITILRFKDQDMAWYLAAYLLSNEGQLQIYRYINGSSGQVEIYPQDIARIWVRPRPKHVMKRIASNFREACTKHDDFYRELTAALTAASPAV